MAAPAIVSRGFEGDAESALDVAEFVFFKIDGRAERIFAKALGAAILSWKFAGFFGQECLRIWITGLEDESVDFAVPKHAVIDTVLDIFGEVGGCLWGVHFIKLNSK